MSISLIRDLKDRRYGVKRALNLIENDIHRILPSKARILIKPNFVSAYDPPSATPVECVEEILKFLIEIVNPKEVIISESPTIGSFEEAVRRYGYSVLKDKYGVELLDLDGYGYDVVYTEAFLFNEIDELFSLVKFEDPIANPTASNLGFIKNKTISYNISWKISVFI
ncbi:MAG: DUF362 domain-containing protein [Candidatus Jordarchaeaceae archaeon]